MRALPFFLALACVGVAAAVDQPQVSFTSGAPGSWNADWNGVTGRTYFLQWSLDMTTWHYAPLVDFGADPEPYAVASQGASKFFIRLKYADVAGVSDLEEARDADFDRDGIPNWYEVEELFTDPLDKASAGGDSDADGLPDGWEQYLIDSNLGDAFTTLAHILPGDDFDGDGIKNLDEARYGLNGVIDDPGHTASHVSYAYDFDALTSATFQTGPATGWTYDNNLNFESASE